MFRTLFLCVILLLFNTGTTLADIVYLQFSGNNASGDVDGSGFSGASWLLEFGVDDSVTDADANAYVGIFPNSIVNAAIQIAGTDYSLGGSSITAQIMTEDWSKYGTGGVQGDRIFVSPGSGGTMQYVTGNNAIYPIAFTDNNDLMTAVIGATVTDNTTGTNGASSRLDFNHSALIGAGGESIKIFEHSGAASGNMTFTVSDSSAFSNAVPEPSIFALLGLGAIGLISYRRCRAVNRKGNG